MDILERLSRNKILYFFLAAAVLFVISVTINFAGDFKIIDPDGYYHVRHAWLYRINGVFDTSFPWTQYSVTRTLGGDLWYGFHLFLIPFTFMSDLVWGIKISGIFITWLALFVYFWAAYRLKLKLALLWPMALPFVSPTVITRLVMTRPHPLSVGLNMLLLSFLVKGGIWPVFITSFLLAFLHLNLFWVPILTLAVLTLARLINRQSLEWDKVLALFSGIMAGALLRPHPIATLKLNYIQLVYLMIQKMKGLKLAFGNELFPMGLHGSTIYVLFAFMALVIFFVWIIKKHIANISISEKITAWVLMVLTTFYLIIAIFLMMRAIEFFVGYLFMFAAFNLTLYFKYDLNDLSKRFNRLARIFIIFIVVSLAGCLGFQMFNRFSLFISSIANPYGQKTAVEWLQKNSKPGEIVFHLGWARFSELFFWNQHNYYISAMDPIFPFAYDQNLYWESHFLSTGEGGEYTCSKHQCTKEEIIRADVVLRDHFKASHIYITSLRDRWPDLFFYLVSRPDKYKIIFLDPLVAIFKII